MKSLSYYIVRTIAILLTIPINHIILEQRNHSGISPLTTFLLITLAYTLLHTFFSSYFYCTYVRNRTKILQVASEFHHSYLPNDLKSL